MDVTVEFRDGSYGITLKESLIGNVLIIRPYCIFDFVGRMKVCRSVFIHKVVIKYCRSFSSQFVQSF